MAYGLRLECLYTYCLGYGWTKHCDSNLWMIVDLYEEYDENIEYKYYNKFVCGYGEEGEKRRPIRSCI